MKNVKCLFLACWGVAALSAGCAGPSSGNDSPYADFAVAHHDLALHHDLAMPGNDADAAMPDVDLAMGYSDAAIDLAVGTDGPPPDLFLLRDLSTPDLAVIPPDMTIPPDLTSLPDMTKLASCMDKIKNGNESDVDCGGGVCQPCGNAMACGKDADCASGLCVTKKCAASPAFKSSTVNVGNTPWGLITYDFNGDANDDVAVVDNMSNDLRVLLGNGNGTFKAPHIYSTGTGPNVLSVDDFDGDGIADLVVCNGGSANVSVFIGLGDGTFLAGLKTIVGKNPQFVTSGDFSGDGFSDLMVSNFDDNTVQYLTGNGDGTFAKKTTYPVTAPLGLASGDWNADAKLDVAAAWSTGAKYSVLAGPNFAAVDYNVGMHPAVIVWGKMNGDNFYDMAVTNFSDGTVSVLLGQAKGVFGASVAYPVGKNPEFITGTDYNSDSYIDLAVANVSDNNVSLLLGQGDGTLRTQITFAAGNGPRGIDTADFNNDKKPDLVVANSGDNNLTVLLNTTP